MKRKSQQIKVPIINDSSSVANSSEEDSDTDEMLLTEQSKKQKISNKSLHKEKKLDMSNKKLKNRNNKNGNNINETIKKHKSSDEEEMDTSGDSESQEEKEIDEEDENDEEDGDNSDIDEENDDNSDNDEENDDNSNEDNVIDSGNKGNVKNMKINQKRLIVRGIKDLNPGIIKKFFKKNKIPIKKINKKPSKNFIVITIKNTTDISKSLKLNGMLLNGKTLNIELDPNTSLPENQNLNDPDSKTLFVKNISDEASKKDLEKIFNNSIDIRLTVQKTNPECHRGFAYIDFKSENDVENALEKFQGKELKGKALFLDHCGSKSTKKKVVKKQTLKPVKEKTKIIYAKNLNYITKENTLKEALGGVSARIVTHMDTGKSRGFGYIDFKNEDEAESSLNENQGIEIDGRKIFLDYSKPKKVKPTAQQNHKKKGNAFSKVK